MIRGWLRHPMLVAVKLWALAHLLSKWGRGRDSTWSGNTGLFGDDIPASCPDWGRCDRWVNVRTGETCRPVTAAAD